MAFDRYGVQKRPDQEKSDEKKKDSIVELSCRPDLYSLGRPRSKIATRPSSRRLLCGHGGKGNIHKAIDVGGPTLQRLDTRRHNSRRVPVSDGRGGLPVCQMVGDIAGQLCVLQSDLKVSEVDWPSRSVES